MQSSWMYSRVSEKAGAFLIISSLNSPSLVRWEGSDSGVLHYFETDGSIFIVQVNQFIFLNSRRRFAHFKY